MGWNYLPIPYYQHLRGWWLEVMGARDRHLNLEVLQYCPRVSKLTLCRENKTKNWNIDTYIWFQHCVCWWPSIFRCYHISNNNDGQFLIQHIHLAGTSEVKMEWQFTLRHSLRDTNHRGATMLQLSISEVFWQLAWSAYVFNKGVRSALCLLMP